MSRSIFRLLAGLSLALLLVACAPRAGLPAPVVPTPLPTEPVASAQPGRQPSPDRSCRVAGDCAVKNVGNCCGYFPACVNRDAKLDPDAVRAQCERDGVASVCGWKDIQACDCVQGQCSAADALSPEDR